MKTQTLTLVAIGCALALVSSATAQNANNLKGMENEFGSIVAPYTVDLDSGRVPVEARVTLNTHYQEKDGRFFMFAFTVEQTPLDVTFDNLIRSDTGEEMTCFKREGTSRDAIKCTVDLHSMPPIGTEIVMRGTVGSSKAGTFTLGALVLPFTATWLKIPMKSGFEAELYAGTAVNSKTGDKALGGLGNKVPGVGLVGVLGVAAVVAIGLAALRRK